MQTPKTARFWVIANGSPVKISLPPGDALGHSTFERTDEGWRSTYFEYEYEDGEVTSTTMKRERDCDGLFDGTYACRCPADELDGCESDFADIRLPRWREGNTTQRDHVAESRGY